jgi:predicted secreted hydrolase
LDNGEALGLWDIYLYGKQSSWVTLVQPDGSQLVANIKPLVESAGDYWTSPTGQRYPTSWIVDITALNAKLIVKSIKKEQEVPSDLLPKYEGLADISGTYQGEPVTGYTLVEMVGNWNKDKKF